jgi:tRNA(adenine34) deaminase
MCAGAIISARIPQVVFGAREENTGACGSVLDLFSENFHHRPAVYAGVCAEESRRLLSRFFQKHRK